MTVKAPESRSKFRGDALLQRVLTDSSKWGIPRTGYFVPGHVGPGLRPDSRVLGKPPPPPPSSPSIALMHWRHWGPIIWNCSDALEALRSKIWNSSDALEALRFKIWNSFDALEALRSKTWTWNIQKSVLRSKDGLSRIVLKPKWLLKIFWNIPVAFRLNFHI